jgi:hypothetical protein
VELAIAF